MSSATTETVLPELQSISTSMIPAELLKLLFDQLQLSVEKGNLQRSCEQAQREMPDCSPLQRLTLILRQLQLRGVQPAQLRFNRFDQRRLPALVFYQGEWQLLERSSGSLQLTNERRQLLTTGEEELQETTVLWLNVTGRRKQSAQQADDGAANPARTLVLGALFASKRWLGDVIIATLLINLFAVATSIFAMQVYDRVVPTLAYATLWTLVAGMVLVIVLDWLLKTARARVLDRLSCVVDRIISQQVFDHITHLQLDQRPQSLGSLAAQVSGLDTVRQFFSSGVIFALVDMPFALLFIAVIGMIGGHVGWVYLALMPLAVILGLISQLRMRKLLQQQLTRSNERQGLLVDTIRGAESIRACNAGWRFSQDWGEITAGIAGYSLRQKSISNLTTVTTASLSSSAYVAAVVVGVGQIEAGALTMGGLIACSILGGRVIAPIAQTVQYLVQWQSVTQSLEMVNQVLLLDTERRSDQLLLMPESNAESIALENVRFSYPESPVLQLDVPRLRFNAGDRVVLLGAVGSGKSTLLKVLSGLYKPGEGRVRLGHADLWEIDPNVVAGQIGYLPQTVHLFKGTLRSNLTLSGAVSDSDLLQVCQDLGIDRIAADNPRSLDLEISEGGEGLSGGQRQQVGLARVFLGRPKIWLLDEPSASLDSESEEKMLKALKAHVSKDDILLIATHRPVLAARLANRMIVMRQGKIVEDGTPDAVIARMKSKQAQASAKNSKSTAAPGGAPAAVRAVAVAGSNKGNSHEQ